MTTELVITGMLGPPDVRGAFTALGAVPGIRSADVTMGRAVLEHAGPLDLARVADALALVGLGVGPHVTHRTLPMAPE